MRKSLLAHLWTWLRGRWRRPVHTLTCPWCHATIPLVADITQQSCREGCIIGPYGYWLMTTTRKEDVA